MKHLSHLIVLLCVAPLLVAAPRPSRAASGLAAAVSSDDRAPITFASGLGGRIMDVAVDGNLAYVIEGARLTVLDVSSPDAPLLRSRAPIPGLADKVAVAGGFVYLMGSSFMEETTLWIYQARGPEPPLLVRQVFFDEGMLVERMQLAGGMLWLGGLFEALLFDLRDPLNPALLNTFECHSCRIQVSGALVYVLNKVSGLEIWDLSDPRAPRLRGEARLFPLSSGISYTAHMLSGSRLYIAAMRSYNVAPGEWLLVTLDVSDPARPTVLTTGFACAEDMSLVRGRLVTVARELLRVYNIDDPANPVLLSQYALGTSSYRVVGDTLYAPAYNRVKIIDLSNLSAPALRGQYRVADGITWLSDMRLEGQRLYIYDLMHIQIFDVSDPLSPTLQGLVPMEYNGYLPDIEGTRVLAPARAGLQLVDASDPGHAEVRSVLPQGLLGQIEGDLAYVITATGLQVLDIRDLANPAPLGSATFSTATLEPLQMLVAGGRAYISRLQVESCGSNCSWRRRTVQVVDVSDPRRPRSGGLVSIPGTVPWGSIRAWAASGTTLFIDMNTLRVVDVSDADTPVLGDYSLEGSVKAIQIVGGRAYIAGSAGLTTLDLADPLRPAVLSSFNFGPEGASQIQIVGERAYVLSRGLRVLDIRDPSNPLPLAVYGSYGVNVAAAGPYAYLAMGLGGLQIVQIHPERFLRPQLLPLVRKS